MSEQLQLRRGTAAQVASFTGAAGEVVVDTTNNRLVLQDGATAGGWPAAKLAEVPTLSRTPVNDVSYTAPTTDRIVAYIAISAPRTVTLPLAASFPAGIVLWVVDESGAVTSTNVVTIAHSGSDTIDGAASATLNGAYDAIGLISNGSNKWTQLVEAPNQSFTQLAIGTAPDPNNALSVSGTSALFNGSNFNLAINKSAVGNTASIIFEDGFSARAQMGLNGSDNYSFKVSPNGSTFVTALALDAATGAATFANLRTAVADAAYSALVTDRMIAYTSLSAARAVSLPAASAFPAGQQLAFVDESGACSATNTITINRAGSDTINGATSAVISAAFGFLSIESNGVGKWTIVDQSTLNMAQQAANSVAIAGGTINGTSAGATTPSTGAFTTLSASSTVSGAGFSTYLASPPAIGGTAAAAGAFTTLSTNALASFNLGATIAGGALTVAAGAATIAPIRMQSGTSLTTAAAGAFEYDGTVGYFSPAASSRGALRAEYFEVLSAAYTLTSQTAAQKLLNGTTNGTVTLPVGAYQFECMFSLTSLSATSGSFGFALGGTATFTQSWDSIAAQPAALATATASTMTFNTAANTALTSASTNTAGHALIKGIIRVTVAGTIIPQVSLTVAAAAIVGANSYFKISPLGAAAVASVGNWS